MKNKLFPLLLLLEGCMLTGAGLVLGETAAGAAGVTALPWSLMADGLRTLSLGGSIGNILAWALFAVCCLWPLALMRRSKTPWMGPLCSGLLGLSLWLLINPSAAAALPGAAKLLALGGGPILGAVLWSALGAWALLELLARSKEADTPALLGLLSRLLKLVCVATVGWACLVGAASLRTALPGLTGLTAAVRVLGWLCSLWASLLAVPVALGVLELLDGLRAGFSEAALAAADKLAATAATCLKASILLSLGYGLLQLGLAPWLTKVNFTGALPLESMAFALGACLLARYIRESKRLRDESDLFI